MALLNVWFLRLNYQHSDGLISGVVTDVAETLNQGYCHKIHVFIYLENAAISCLFCFEKRCKKYLS